MSIPYIDSIRKLLDDLRALTRADKWLEAIQLAEDYQKEHILNWSEYTEVEDIIHAMKKRYENDNKYWYERIMITEETAEHKMLNEKFAISNYLFYLEHLSESFLSPRQKTVINKLLMSDEVENKDKIYILESLRDLKISTELTYRNSYIKKNYILNPMTITFYKNDKNIKYILDYVSTKYKAYAKDSLLLFYFESILEENWYSFFFPINENVNFKLIADMMAKSIKEYVDISNNEKNMAKDDVEKLKNTINNRFCKDLEQLYGVKSIANKKEGKS